MRPCWLRPAVLWRTPNNGVNGLPLCKFLLTTFTIPRRPEEVGLTYTSVILLSLRLKMNFLPRLQAHVGLFNIFPASHQTPDALCFAFVVYNLNRVDFNFKQPFNRGFHFLFIRIRRHPEHDLRTLICQ